MIVWLDEPAPAAQRTRWLGAMASHLFALVLCLPIWLLPLYLYAEPSEVPGWVTEPLLHDQVHTGAAAILILLVTLLFQLAARMQVGSDAVPRSDAAGFLWRKLDRWRDRPWLREGEQMIAAAASPPRLAGWLLTLAYLAALAWLLATLCLGLLLTSDGLPHAISTFVRGIFLMAVATALLVTTSELQGAVLTFVAAAPALGLAGWLGWRTVGPVSSPWTVWAAAASLLPLLLVWLDSRRPSLAGLVITNQRILGIRRWGLGPPADGSPAWWVHCCALTFRPRSAESAEAACVETCGFVVLMFKDGPLAGWRLALDPADLPDLMKAAKESGGRLRLQPPERCCAGWPRRLLHYAAAAAVLFLAARAAGQLTARYVVECQVIGPVELAAQRHDAGPYERWSGRIQQARPADVAALAGLVQAAESLKRHAEALVLYRGISALAGGQGRFGRFATHRLAALADTPGTRPPVPGAP